MRQVKEPTTISSKSHNQSPKPTKLQNERPNQQRQTWLPHSHPPALLHRKEPILAIAARRPYNFSVAKDVPKTSANIIINVARYQRNASTGNGSKAMQTRRNESTPENANEGIMMRERRIKNGCVIVVVLPYEW